MEVNNVITEKGLHGVPRMPEGFEDQTAWDVIHWKFSESGTSTLDQLVISWQLLYQDRIKAAIAARDKAE